MPEVLAVGAEEVDDRLGDDAAHATRGESALLHRQLAPGRVAVEGGGRQRRHDLRDAGAAGRVEHAEHRRERAPELDRRHAVAGHQGEVEDLARSVHRDQGGEIVAARVERVDVQLADVQPGRLGAGRRQVAERPGREVVDDVDRAALGDQALDEVGADEAGATDDEHPTGAPIAHRGLGCDAGRAVIRRRGLGHRRSCSRDGILASAPTTVRTTTASATDGAGDDRVLDDGAGADHRAAQHDTIR